MYFEDFDTTLNIDYAGFYLDEGSGREAPELILRLYIYRDPTGRVRGLDVASSASTSLEQAIDNLSSKVDIWFLEKYKMNVNSKEIFEASDDLKKKFNRWLGIRPDALRQAKTITVNL